MDKTKSLNTVFLLNIHVFSLKYFVGCEHLFTQLYMLYLNPCPNLMTNKYMPRILTLAPCPFVQIQPTLEFSVSITVGVLVLRVSAAAPFLRLFVIFSHISRDFLE